MSVSTIFYVVGGVLTTVGALRRKGSLVVIGVALVAMGFVLENPQ